MSIIKLEKIYGYSILFLEGVVLNFLWVFFILLGGGILGWMPASIAVMRTIREKHLTGKHWGIGDTVKRVYCTFKEEFVSGNKVGCTILLLYIVLSFNIYHLSAMKGDLFNVLTLILLSARWLLYILSILILAIYSHYRMNTRDYFKGALETLFFIPMLPLALILWSFIVMQGISLIPEIGFLIGGFIYLYGIVVISYEFFRKKYKFIMR